ncbi:gamma-glutamylcyclotransferase family protein [Rhizobium leucaenae]|uniref:Gamma-glutamylcyclotransferase family protein n=1 Tax=Rhizobium leucaenae TaxID=29450 RepID=A0A7W7EIJ6_9HYPH|nr:gamma-glutamylcyclotransferase family protein [Rhizobium leucaenae]MBB4566836.1 gamma-glutamylaminecyclotransferase [Rhizobium leucaenae]
MSISAAIRLFAFGTLKRGFSLHERGLARAQYRGFFQTRKPYPMLIAGRWFAPMMFDEPGNGTIVRGELYELDDQALRHLDAMESIGKPGHFRGLIELEPVAGGNSCIAFAYFKSRSLAKPIHSNYLSTYDDRRFVPPEQRIEKAQDQSRGIYSKDARLR